MATRSGSLSWRRLLAASLITASIGMGAEEGLPIHDGVGGEFSAPSSLGRDVRLSDYRGKVVLLFFGYTSCQDVCPVTLSHLKSLLKRLGPTADAVQVLFVTVDPETDTAEHLRQYLARFDSRFVGLTGTPDQIDRIAGLFLAKHARSHDVHVSTEYHRTKTFTDRAYLYTHSQQIYLLDAAGRTRSLFFSGSPLEEMERAVRLVSSESSGEAQGVPPCDSGDGGCSEALPERSRHDHRSSHEGTRK